MGNKFIADNVEIFVSYISLETFMVAQGDINIINNKQKKSKSNHHNSNSKEQSYNNYIIPIKEQNDTINKPRIPQNQYQKQYQKHSKSKSNHNYDRNKRTDFARYDSNAIYQNNSENSDDDNNKEEKHQSNNNNDNEEEKDNIIKNPTVTFHINDEQNE